jgi:putative flippase GtrA
VTCPTLALRRGALLLTDAPNPARAVADLAASVRTRLAAEGTVAQLSRFAIVGLLSSGLYAAVFVTFGSLGNLAANLIGMVASTLLANELHRRLTFHASAAVGWLRAQLEGGGLALIGLLVTSSALLVLEAVVPDAGWLLQVLLVAAVTGGIGLLRFVALRAWVFTAFPAARSER